MEAKLLESRREKLLRYEGLRLKPYCCTCGNISIGVGSNLDDCGVFQEGLFFSFRGDILQCEG